MEKTEIATLLNEKVNTAHQFAYENGVTVTEARPGYARGELAVGGNSINPFGTVHGGALTALADTVAGCCACADGRTCVTMGCSMEFLRPALGPLLVCEAEPKKLGKTLSVIQIAIKNTENKPVVTGTFTFFMQDIK